MKKLAFVLLSAMTLMSLTSCEGKKKKPCSCGCVENCACLPGCACACNG